MCGFFELLGPEDVNKRLEYTVRNQNATLTLNGCKIHLASSMRLNQLTSQSSAIQLSDESLRTDSDHKLAEQEFII